MKNGFLNIWMAITHWAQVNSLNPNKDIPQRTKGMSFGSKQRGTPFMRVKGTSDQYQSSDGQLYVKSSAGTLYRINHDGTRQYRRGN